MLRKAGGRGSSIRCLGGSLQKLWPPPVRMEAGGGLRRNGSLADPNSFSNRLMRREAPTTFRSGEISELPLRDVLSFCFDSTAM